MEMGNLCDLSIVYRIRLHFVRHNGSRNEVHLLTCSNITLARISFFVVVVDVTFQCTSIYPSIQQRRPTTVIVIIMKDTLIKLRRGFPVR